MSSKLLIYDYFRGKNKYARSQTHTQTDASISTANKIGTVIWPIVDIICVLHIARFLYNIFFLFFLVYELHGIHFLFIEYVIFASLHMLRKGSMSIEGKSLCTDAVVFNKWPDFHAFSYVDVFVLFLRAYFNAWMILNFLRFVFYKLLTKWAAHVNEIMIAYLESYFVFGFRFFFFVVGAFQYWKVDEETDKNAEILIFFRILWFLPANKHPPAASHQKYWQVV